jgi:hypothetical protein
MRAGMNFCAVSTSSPSSSLKVQFPTCPGHSPRLDSQMRWAYYLALSDLGKHMQETKMTRDSRTFHMRRKDKEVTDPAAIDRIIKEAKICHLGLVDEDEPYVVPVNFGYEEDRIYFHSALKGRKVDIIKNNNKVCFNMVIGIEVMDLSPKSCKVKYKSVTGVGIANILKDRQEKIPGLKAIMRHNLGHEYDFSLDRLDSTLVVRIDIQEIKGKQAT